jgi:hypothetical protein
MGNVQRLQDGLKKLWTDELYSEQFRVSPSKYKHFDHALKHVLKASVKLLEMTEEADHGGSFFEIPAVEKYVADLLICAVRLANVAPNGALNLEKIVFDRIERKMGARIESESDIEEERLKAQVKALRAALWDKVKQWDDPSDRNYMACGICGAHEFKKHETSCVLSE